MFKTTSDKRRHGWLVVNAFLNTNKFNELADWFIKSAEKLDITLSIYTNAELLVGIELAEKPDFVLFWDKDVLLAEYLEGFGIPVFNSARSIALCDDKGKTYLALKDSGIPMPRTILAPFTYGNIGYNRDEFLDNVAKELGFPLVMKENYGSFGMQVYLVNNMEELKAKLNEISPKPCLFQEFIKCSAGKDIRLQVVGGKVIATMYRYSDNGDFRANVSLGGKMEEYKPSKEQIDIALTATKRLGLVFGGVDLLFGEDGKPILCEVNSNAHFKSIHSCTGVDASYEIMKYIKEQVYRELKSFLIC